VFILSCFFDRVLECVPATFVSDFDMQPLASLWLALVFCAFLKIRRVALTQEAKEIVCSSDRLLGFLREACTCSIENIRISSISVVMQCSSNDSARVNLIKAYIPERALKTVM